MSLENKLTVLLTVYNGMPYLPDTVKSVLNQNDNSSGSHVSSELKEDNSLKFNLLIINNASTDGTAEYLKQINDPRVKIIHNKVQKDRTQALNQGLELIFTEYTAIIDADDLALDGRFVNQLNFLEENQNIVLLGSNIEYIDTEGRVIGFETYPVNHKDLCSRLPLFNQFAHAACMFRTEAVKLVGGYPEDFKYAQDLALWLKLITNNYQVASLAHNYAAIRLHKAQATRSKEYQELRLLDELRLHKLMLKLPNIDANVRQFALFRVAVAAFKLGRRNQAKRAFTEAFKEKFFLFNPLFWLRLKIELKRLYKKSI
ncbi:glycosyltransferase family 2 protein [Desulfovibrio litoralis]|uniref:Glycosyltransferase involved in cell wall bisynthesis n=1 Tax=Desulfovibrio litoralis DSM 11393 TaxID=1121455 RepID=A0A1M7RTY4_9BACT|nr:glycosyltransferase [Desulfovibrio litoralis]SHN49664.1 Glycosyltransferase involved in cell wall bisynthesis [Desulfovibrio litoralis DSM 11393]